MNRNTRKCSCMNNVENSIETELQYENPSSYEYNSCECGFEEQNTFPTGFSYGQSYVPVQYLDKTFTPEVGLKVGTIFPELVSPYMPCDGMMQNKYLRNYKRVGGCNNV